MTCRSLSFSTMPKWKNKTVKLKEAANVLTKYSSVGAIQLSKISQNRDNILL
jgi:hypothetical protein